MARYSFHEYHLDVAERRLRRGKEEVRLRNKIFDTLCVLVENAGRLVRKHDLMRAVWPDAIVEENNVDHCVSRLRKVLGGEPSQFIETVPRQGYRFVCPVHHDNLLAIPIPVSEARGAAPPKMPPQRINSFVTQDGVNIAYSQCGSGPPLVKAANWLNHLEFEWRSPIWAHWVTEFTRHHTLYRYDERGNGLSDWNIADFSFQAWVRDFAQLIDTIQLERFPILGISQGGAVALSYAARHPQRVSKLILCGAFARGWMFRGIPGEIERRNALLTLVRLGWGQDNPAFRQMFTTLWAPTATPEQADWLNELQRVTTSPDNAAQLMVEAGKINIVDLLPKVKCPTLVLHGRDDASIPLAEGRLLAARIPGAKFVELPTCNHLVIPPEPAWDIFLEAVSEFMEWDKGGKVAVAQPQALSSR